MAKRSRSRQAGERSDQLADTRDIGQSLADTLRQQDLSRPPYDVLGAANVALGLGSLTELRKSLDAVSGTYERMSELADQILATQPRIDMSVLFKNWEAAVNSTGVADAVRAAVESIPRTVAAAALAHDLGHLATFRASYPGLAELDKLVAEAAASPMGSFAALVQAPMTGSFTLDTEIAPSAEEVAPTTAVVALAATTSLSPYERTILALMLFQCLVATLQAGPMVWENFARPLIQLIEQLLR